MPDAKDSVALLEDTRRWSASVVLRALSASHAKWTIEPGLGARLVLGKWNSTAVRHLLAMHVLSQNGDLAMVSKVHYRQIIELMLQVRHFVREPADGWDKLAERVSAWGCVEELDKLEPVKDRQEYRVAYEEVAEQLSMYDPSLVSTIRRERGSHQQNWFGCSYSKLAQSVSTEGKDLRFAYGMISADMHGVWDVTWGAIQSSPTSLDFRGYPDLETMHQWAAEHIQGATEWYLQLWNDIAIAVGAPMVGTDEQ